MAVLTNETIWLGRSNSVDLQLYSDGEPADLGAVTEVRLKVGTAVIASTDSAGGLIRWNQSGYGNGEIRIFAGGSTMLIPGRYYCSLVVFDPSATAGVVWDDDLLFSVKSDPLAT